MAPARDEGDAPGDGEDDDGEAHRRADLTGPGRALDAHGPAVGREAAVLSTAVLFTIVVDVSYPIYETTKAAPEGTLASVKVPVLEVDVVIDRPDTVTVAPTTGSCVCPSFTVPRKVVMVCPNSIPPPISSIVKRNKGRSLFIENTISF